MNERDEGSDDLVRKLLRHFREEVQDVRNKRAHGQARVRELNADWAEVDAALGVREDSLFAAMRELTDLL